MCAHDVAWFQCCTPLSACNHKPDIDQHCRALACSIQMTVCCGVQKALSLVEEQAAMRTALPRDMFSCLGIMHAEDVIDVHGLTTNTAPFIGCPADTSESAQGKQAVTSRLRQTYQKLAALFADTLASQDVLDAAVDEHARRFLAARLPPVWLPSRPKPPLDELPQHCRLRCLPNPLCALFTAAIIVHMCTAQMFLFSHLLGVFSRAKCR
jgi:hypothetical protein